MSYPHSLQVINYYVVYVGLYFPAIFFSTTSRRRRIIVAYLCRRVHWIKLSHVQMPHKVNADYYGITPSGVKYRRKCQYTTVRDAYLGPCLTRVTATQYNVRSAPA